MKQCPKCGKLLADDADICNECGNKFSVDDNSNSNKANYGMKKKQFTSNNPNKRKFPKFILTALLVLAILLSLLFIFRNKIHIIRKEVDLTKCITEPKYSGIDGEGSLDENSVDWDSEALENAIKEAMYFEEGDEEPYISDIMDDFTLSVDKKDNLRNGDVIKIQINYHNKELYENKYKVRFEGSVKEVKVKYLQELTEKDPFADLELKFTGYSPEGSMKTNYGLESYGQVKVTVNDEEYSSSKLKIGDTVKFKITDIGKENMKKNGYKPSREEYTHVISEEDMGTYITKYEDIKEDTLNIIKREAEDQMKKELYNDDGIIKKSFIGSYFIIPKDNVWDGRTHPFISLVYEVQKKESKEYYQVSISKLVNEKPEGSKKEQSFDHNNIKSPRRYSSLEELEKEVVDLNAVDYILEYKDDGLI